MAAKVTPDAGVGYQDYLNAAAAGGKGTVTWFQFNGNTYTVQDRSGASGFVNGTDVVVELAGLVNLGTATLTGTLWGPELVLG